VWPRRVATERAFGEFHAVSIGHMEVFRKRNGGPRIRSSMILSLWGAWRVASMCTMLVHRGGRRRDK
jgi:hypothetical protein